MGLGEILSLDNADQVMEKSAEITHNAFVLSVVAAFTLFGADNLMAVLKQQVENGEVNETTFNTVLWTRLVTVSALFGLALTEGDLREAAHNLMLGFGGIGALAFVFQPTVVKLIEQPQQTLRSAINFDLWLRWDRGRVSARNAHHSLPDWVSLSSINNLIRKFRSVIPRLPGLRCRSILGVRNE